MILRIKKIVLFFFYIKQILNCLLINRKGIFKKIYFG